MTNSKEAFIKECEREPSIPGHWRQLGELYLKEGNTSKARECYTKVAELEPSAAAFAIVGSCWLTEDKPDSAIQPLELAHNLEPGEPEIAGALGTAYFRTRKFEEAKPLLVQAAEADPTNEEAHMALARIAAVEQDFLSAIELCSRVLKSDPVDEQSPLLLMGDSFLGLGELARAEQCYEAAVALAPENDQVIAGLASLYMMQGKLVEAEAEYARAQAVNPNSVDAHLGMANLRVLQDRPVEAEAEYRKAVRLAPRTASVYGLLASSLLLQGKIEQADVVARQGIDLDPMDLSSLLAAAQVAELNELYAISAELAARAAGVQPDSFHAHLIRARSMIRLGEPSVARKHLELANEVAVSEQDKKKVASLMPLT